MVACVWAAGRVGATGELSAAVVAVLAALLAMAGSLAEFGDDVGEFISGVVAEFVFEPPEHADGHCGDEGDHEQAGDGVGHADLVGVAAAAGHFEHDERSKIKAPPRRRHRQSTPRRI